MIELLQNPAIIKFTVQYCGLSQVAILGIARLQDCRIALLHVRVSDCRIARLQNCINRVDGLRDCGEVNN